jgi:demethylmenaquinone methyltransferase/2-methoxy-6-polyprenyl-1,4-benzoquinol methylase
MYQKDSPTTIQSMFDSIAKRYDLTNAVLSFSLHKRWNRALIQHIQKHAKPHTYLDLCAGTGEIAFNFLKKATQPCHAYLIDFSPKMLECAKEKAQLQKIPALHQLSFLEADVQMLPLADGIADCATMAYGIRNVKDPAKCMQEVHRVLKPGGTFGILELTRPKYQAMRLAHRLYLNTLIPLLGRWLTDNQEAYAYLCQSIQTFYTPQALSDSLGASGFVNLQCHSLWGGIATIILGQKKQ